MVFYFTPATAAKLSGVACRSHSPSYTHRKTNEPKKKTSDYIHLLWRTVLFEIQMRSFRCLLLFGHESAILHTYVMLCTRYSLATYGIGMAMRFQRQSNFTRTTEEKK